MRVRSCYAAHYARSRDAHTHGNEVAASVAGRGPLGGGRATIYSLVHRSGIFSYVSNH